MSLKWLVIIIQIVTALNSNHFRAKSITIILLFLLCLINHSAWAGPPFMTDDPEPVEYHHWEIYIASQWTTEKGSGTVGTLPHIDANYGIAKDLHLHVQIPIIFCSFSNSLTQYGLGDMEAGFKYRFINEDDDGWRPQIAIYPTIDFPTGDSNKGLGEGQTKIFLPLWLQKKWGDWTTYGGGGYWYHPSDNTKDYLYIGWVLQRDISKTLTFGAEIFNTSPKTKGTNSETGFNIGGFINLNKEHHILYSVGRDIAGSSTLIVYFAYQWTPDTKDDEKK